MAKYLTRISEEEEWIILVRGRRQSSTVGTARWWECKKVAGQSVQSESGETKSQYPRNDTTHIQCGSSLLSETCLETSSQTCLFVS